MTEKMDSLEILKVLSEVGNEAISDLQDHSQVQVERE